MAALLAPSLRPAPTTPGARRPAARPEPEPDDLEALDAAWSTGGPFRAPRIGRAAKWPISAQASERRDPLAAPLVGAEIHEGLARNSCSSGHVAICVTTPFLLGWSASTASNTRRAGSRNSCCVSASCAWGLQPVPCRHPVRCWATRSALLHADLARRTDHSVEQKQMLVVAGGIAGLFLSASALLPTHRRRPGRAHPRTSARDTGRHPLLCAALRSAWSRSALLARPWDGSVMLVLSHMGAGIVILHPVDAATLQTGRRPGPSRAHLV